MAALWIALGATLLITAAGVWLGTRLEEGCLLAALVGGVSLLLGALICMPIGVTYAYAHHNERTLTCTVTDKDRGGNSGSYRVYTEQCGVLANQDSMWRGKWDSADLWNQIEPGQTYTFRVVGWRFGFLSTFPNILASDPAEET